VFWTATHIAPLPMRMPPDPSPDGAVADSLKNGSPRPLVSRTVSDQVAMQSGAMPEEMAAASVLWRDGRGGRRTVVWTLGRAARVVVGPELPLREVRSGVATVVSTGRRRRLFWRGFPGR
jgi:hypothetical protein